LELILFMILIEFGVNFYKDGEIYWQFL